ncbi:DUF5610 domain-containing protein [Motiliproteus sp. MSK22-1]|uniref:DUF5610 domain-containing protein n=1 Tax=Motiliproteus sp. MSK22-1 TaxID=1897630 RepID=UPI00097826A6|nr:DUF5610 domain-containing protein [Motiliproteus sp. MSK22-1]OMH39564.1 hypothetical protein BGP75_02950 [Motiliproteus sp. MSK22-1]
MAIPSIGSSSASGQTAEAKAPENPEQMRQQNQKQQNVAILEAHRTLSLSAKNQPLSLVYQAAIDAINETLAPELGEQAIERAHEEGLDVSPQATADRILSLTTGMFSRFQQHRPELAEPEQVERFLQLISSGIDQGFAEAKDILDGLGVLEGDIASNIDKTYELVQQGLQEFRERFASSETSVSDPPS